MNYRQFLFSFKGRIGRGDFWLLMLTMIAMIAIAVIVGYLIPNETVTSLVGFVCAISAMVVFFAAATRRLHDRDKSAWYLLIFFVLPSVLQAFHKGSGSDFSVYLFSGGLNSFLDIVCLGISIWMIVELGCLRGSAGANQYGPDPLTPVTAPVDGG